MDRVYRYGLATLVGLEAANYTAWAFNMIDWRCIAAAVVAAALVLAFTGLAVRQPGR